MLFAAALVVILGGAPLAAEDDAAQARQAFDAAQKFYQQSRYLPAIAKFEEAYRLKPHPSIFFNIGRCYDRLKDLPRALLNYRAYLKAVPEAKDKGTVVEAISSLERRMKAKGVQQLIVYAEPAGALVKVDGKELSGSPATVELSAGNHLLLITAEGHVALERSFAMPADKSLELSHELRVAVAPPPTPPPAVQADTPKPEPTAAATPVTPVAVGAATTAAEAPAGPSSKAWMPAVGGGLLLIGGGICYGLAWGTEGRLRDGDPTLADPAVRAGAIRDAKTLEVTGFVLGGTGVAALLVSGVMLFLPKPQGPVAVRVAPALGGAVISGEFP